jgi:hypothetical protein
MMEIITHENEGQKIFEIVSDRVVLQQAQDALDIIGQVGAEARVVLYKDNIAPDFFDLGTRLAGEVLQKFTNYRVRVAIVGDFSHVTSESLKAFIAESNRGNQTAFLPDFESAKEFLSKD